MVIRTMVIPQDGASVRPNIGAHATTRRGDCTNHRLRKAYPVGRWRNRQDADWLHWDSG